MASDLLDLQHARAIEGALGRRGRENREEDMQIRVGYSIAYECSRPTPMVLLLSVHPSRLSDLVGAHRIVFDPPLEARDYRDIYGNTCTRIVAPAGRLAVSTDLLIEDPGTPDVVQPDAEQVAIDKLPDEVLVYLLGSRYCETDRLSEIAWQSFEKTPPGWARVQVDLRFCPPSHHFRIRACAPHEDSVGGL
jgi:transglutaminase-like putative cysteine protease